MRRVRCECARMSVVIACCAVLAGGLEAAAQTCEDAGSGSRTVFGDTSSESDDCTLGGAGAADKLFKITLTEGEWVFTMAPSDDDWDSVLYISDSSCCASDVGSAADDTHGGHEEIAVTVSQAGPFVYYFGVDGASAVEDGPFILSVTEVDDDTQYRVIDLGVITNEQGVAPITIGTFGINNEGQVAFAQAVSTKLQARVFLPEDDYNRTRGFVSLEGEGDEWIARDINEDGIAVGQIDDSGITDEQIDKGGLKLNGGQAALWKLDDEGTPVPVTKLGFLPNVEDDLKWSRAHAINNGPDAVVCGEAGQADHCPLFCQSSAKDASHGFRIAADPVGAIVEHLPVFTCYPSAKMWDVNNASTVEYAGFADVYVRDAACAEDTCATGARPMVWTAAAAADTPSYDPPEQLPFGEGAFARAINDDGQLVGWGVPDLTCNSEALFWESRADMTPDNLNQYVSQDNSRAWGMSNDIDPGSDHVVLVVGTNVATLEAVVWKRVDNGSTVVWSSFTLNETNAPFPGAVYTSAQDVNDSGWIVGTGILNQKVHAFLFTPVDDIDCPGDVDGDGDVDFADLLEVLGLYDQNCGEGFCPDANFDGHVDFDDILIVLSTWGPCPGSSNPEPTSIKDLYDQMTLDYPEDWHDFLATAQDGSQADKDNYICWLTHYYDKHVLGCLDPPNCPASDPWDGTHF